MVVKPSVRPNDAVGIDDLAIYVPKLFLPTTGEFAASRGIDPVKLTRGIGIERMAIPDAHEDAATMAAMSLLQLMRRNDLCPDEIGKIYIGTESAVDEAKAIGTYVIGMLEKLYGQGSFQSCSTVEFKSACIGTTLALENLSYWAAAEDEDRIGIVIATDIARYPLRSSGEYTQGAGSVALLVKKKPRLIELEPVFGSFTRDENDFFRPLGASTAIVSGKHSNLCYLNAVGGAFDAYARRSRQKGLMSLKEGECVTDFISHLLFHIPYPRMVEYAAASLFRQEWKDLPKGKEVESEIGCAPESQGYDSREAYLKAVAEYEKRFARSMPFRETFAAKALDSTAISRQVGNIYTGSIYLGLASLLEQQKLLPGERVCFLAYGSGCSALVFSGIVSSRAGEVPLRNILQRLEARTEISLGDYEDLHEGRRNESILAPCGEFALVKIDEQGYRHYEFL